MSETRGVQMSAALALSLLLLITGLALYLTWAAMYDAWFDIGLYSVCILMILFGLINNSC